MNSPTKSRRGGKHSRPGVLPADLKSEGIGSSALRRHGGRLAGLDGHSFAPKKVRRNANSRRRVSRFSAFKDCSPVAREAISEIEFRRLRSKGTGETVRLVDFGARDLSAAVLASRCGAQVWAVDPKGNSPARGNVQLVCGLSFSQASQLLLPPYVRPSAEKGTDPGAKKSSAFNGVDVILLNLDYLRDPGGRLKNGEIGERRLSGKMRRELFRLDTQRLHRFLNDAFAALKPGGLLAIEGLLFGGDLRNKKLFNLQKRKGTPWPNGKNGFIFDKSFGDSLPVPADFGYFKGSSAITKINTKLPSVAFLARKEDWNSSRDSFARSLAVDLLRPGSAVRIASKSSKIGPSMMTAKSAYGENTSGDGKTS